MATIWEILELDGPTTDDRAIKSAYAKRVRAVRPDEDQAGFMALRDAFDRARTYARIHAEEINTDKIFDAQTASPANVDAPSREPDESESFDYTEDYKPQDPASEYFDDAADFSFAENTALSPQEEKELEFQDIMREKIAVLIRSPWTINSETAWAQLFSEPELESLDSETKFQGVLRMSLLALSGFFGGSEPDSKMRLKSSTATFIFDRMGWMNPAVFGGRERQELQWLAEVLGVRLDDQPSKEEIEFYEGDDEDGVSWKIVLGTVIAASLFIYLGNRFL